MRDNKTSQAANEYDANVHKTLPRYHLFHTETLDLVKTVVPKPQAWLDSGCGTGTLVLQAIECFGKMKIVAADPAESMLSMAKEKLANYEITYMPAGSEELCCPDSFDVVTAIMSHHYLQDELRIKATNNCYKLLKRGGVYVTFETIRPISKQGIQIGLERWKNAQLLSGKNAAAVEKHISRYGIEIFPITIQDHINILQAAGFSTVEILWVSCMQAGFYGIK
ncbi:class I SAM-dependent methyltransferase [Sporomusa acidovorans]|uniref:Carboxy-S-adenosyl-L-methionine synthase n=1 Tax=Sporomusa acidovorans (strain ATCC 49682 / DSM 3132 / Mol) TaxID=1123286 RepID=A0ABZ3J280_SPOA4|nr:class I SAM-dependent methyltransferase [Sporomusa acidovorans]OZC19956.1 ubiquinone/menaquinone biosynthesis C-methyltransferase UbiE [Sporomusa acidovorans DSM 3132]SDD49096.1 tRNA (cmo5U34)-methyltransferase [Sporomusa acidovorans]